MRRKFTTDILDASLRRKRLENETSRQKTLQQVMNLLPQMARTYGFREAYVFGSLSKPEHFRKTSDVDLAVVGLKSQNYFALMAALSNKLEREIDLIQLERHVWRKRILETGIRWNKTN